MSENQEDKPTLDSEVEKELDSIVAEEQIIGQYGSGEGSQERLSLVKSWFPETDNWDGKTKINARQARSIAIARNMAKVFPELVIAEEFIQTVIEDYEILLTSVKDKNEETARDDQVRIMTSMFGGVPENDDVAQSALGQMIAANSEDNDD